MDHEIIPVPTEPASETPEAHPPMHPLKRMAVIEDAVVVALDPEATEEEREQARQTIVAMREGGEA